MLFSVMQPVNCEIRVWTFGLSASGTTDGVLNLTFTHYYETKKTHFSLAQRDTETVFFFKKDATLKIHQALQAE